MGTWAEKNFALLSGLVTSVASALVYGFDNTYSMVGKYNVAKHWSPLSNIESPEFYT